MPNHPDNAGNESPEMPAGDGPETARPTPASYEALRSGALQTSAAILAAQRRAEQELLRAKEELAAANAWQRTILDSADVSIIATDPQGVIRTFNRAAERMLGYRAEEVVGKTTPGIIHDPAEVQCRAAELSRELGRVIEPGFEVFVVKTRSGAPEEREWTYLRKDGSRFPVRLSVTAMFDAAGRITGFMGIATDLTERKHEEERFRLVVEAAPNGIVVVNEAGEITLVNAQTEKAFGYTRAELVGQPIEVLVPERYRAAHPAQRRGFLADPKTRAMGAGRDLFGRRKDGSEFPLEIGLSPITAREGLVVLAAVVDVTGRKRAEAALREAHDELERRVRERTAELTTTNESLRHEIVQRQQAEGSMKGDEEVMGMIAAGRPLSDILETLARNLEAQTSGALCSILLLDADGVHLRHGAAPSLPEAYNRAIDGVAIGPGVGSCGTAAYLRQQVIVADIATDPLWADFSGLALRHELRACWSTPIQSADGRVLGTFAMYYRQPRSPTPKDFATIDRATYLAGIAIERKQVEAALLRAKEDLEIKVVERTAELQAATEQAKSADRLKSTFLATMSHELRTPLNSIIGFTGIILQGLAGPLNPEQTKQLEMVRGSARHLLALINDVLDISKIEAGELEVSSEPFDLRASIGKVVGIVAPLAEKNGLALRAEIAPEVGQAVGDPRRVEQILLNLLNNAIKFTDCGEVALTVELISDFKLGGAPGQPAVRLRVSDTGMGIKPEDLATLFQPFRQIDSTLSRNHEGTGLGLAICRRLAELLGGEIRAESEWGKGSVFTFIMPLKGPTKS